MIAERLAGTETMTDLLRRFLMPVAVCTIVGTVWAMAWLKEVEFKSDRESHDGQTYLYKPANEDESADMNLEPIAPKLESASVAD